MANAREQHAALFAEYQATGSVEVRNRLTEAYLPLLKSVAEKVRAKLPAEVELDDLIQAGAIGLIEAVTKFDPSRAVVFSTFASYRIWGSIMDYLREIDWVPRLVRTRLRRVAAAASTFEADHARPPSMAELLKLLAPPDHRFARMLYQPPAVMNTTLDVPVSGPIEGTAMTARESIVDHREHDPVQRLASNDAFDGVISLVLRDYTVTDALMLRMYYREGVTLATCGVHLGNVSEPRMWQRRKELLAKLRKRRLVRELAELKGAA